MRELDLFRVRAARATTWSSATSPTTTAGGTVKETLLKSVGMGGVPVIRVEDADFGDNRTLLLAHDHDGRDLQLEYAEKTLAYVHRLWGREVVLETMHRTASGRDLTFGERGFSAKAGEVAPRAAPPGVVRARRRAAIIRRSRCRSTSTAAPAAGGR